MQVIFFAAEADAHAAEATSGGLPQLDPTFFASQIFWIIIVILALHWWLSRNILPKIGGVLEQRGDSIANDLDEAARLQDRARQTAAALEASLDNARAKARSTLADTRRNAELEAQAELQAAEAAANQKIGQAQARLSQQRAAAMAEIQAIAADLARDMAERVSGGSFPAEEAQRSVGSILEGTKA